MQLREAEESGIVLRSVVAASASLGLLAFVNGSFVGILDLPMFAADASTAGAEGEHALQVLRMPQRIQIKAHAAIISTAGMVHFVVSCHVQKAG